MATEPLLGYPYPAGTDLVSAGDDAIRSLAEAVRLRSVLIFASSAARTSAFSAASITLGASHDGLWSYLQDVDRYERWNGALWIPWAYMLSARVDTSQTTATTTYVDLTTVGPAVTITTDTTAEVTIGAGITPGGASLHAYMSFAVSGATTLAADDSRALYLPGTLEFHHSRVIPVTGLTAGSNTFTAKYKVNGGTGTWRYRTLHVRT